MAYMHVCIGIYCYNFSTTTRVLKMVRSKNNLLMYFTYVHFTPREPLNFIWIRLKFHFKRYIPCTPLQTNMSHNIHPILSLYKINQKRMNLFCRGVLLFIQEQKKMKMNSKLSFFLYSLLQPVHLLSAIEMS